MSIEKRNNGYTVRWRDSTGQQRSQQVRLWREATALDIDVKRKKSMGALGMSEKGEVFLSDFWPEYWNNYAATQVSPRTRENYEIAWRCHIMPALGYRRLKDLTTQHIAGFAAAQSSRGLKSGTVRRHLTVLQGVLGQAVAWNYIATNPAIGVKRPAQSDRRRGHAMTDDELWHLLSMVEQLHSERSRAIVELLAHTGLRPGEMRALTWADVRPEHIVVDKAITGNTVAPTKNFKKRNVHLSQRAIHALEILHDNAARPPGLRDYVVQGMGAVDPKCSGVWTDDGYRLWARRVFAPSAKAVGLKGMHVYDLRHTFVSDLISQGKDIYWIARQAGHEPSMALSTYAHLLKEVRQECADDSYLVATFSKKPLI